MNKLYVDQPVEITINVTLGDGDWADVTAATIEYSKPGGTTGSWVAGQSGSGGSGTVTYSAPYTEIDEAGTWHLQPVITISGSAIPGTTVTMTINERFS